MDLDPKTLRPGLYVIPWELDVAVKLETIAADRFQIDCSATTHRST